MKIAAAFPIFFLYLFSSCSKTETSKEDMLTAGKWQVTGYICYCGGTSPLDIYAAYITCEKDDYYMFYKGGTAEVNDGATKCKSSNVQSYTESWSFNSDATRFMYKGKDWSIVQLNKTTFVISQ